MGSIGLVWLPSSEHILASSAHLEKPYCLAALVSIIFDLSFVTISLVSELNKGVLLDQVFIPRLIVIDGGRGCRKDELLAELVEHFAGRNIEFFRAGKTSFDEENLTLFKKEGGVGPTSSRLHFIGFWKALRWLIERFILPAFARGNHVGVVRFDSSISAYQIWGEDDHQLMMAFRLLRDAMLEGARPSVYILLDVDPLVGAERAKESGEMGLFSDRPIEFHYLVQRGFVEHVSQYNSRILDDNGDFDLVVKEAIEIIENLL